MAPAPAGRALVGGAGARPARRVDLLLIGDGYTAAERDKWHRDAARLAEALFAVPPFRERRRDFNVWAIDVASDESGVSRPSDGVFRRSALGATYDAFGSERYVLAFATRACSMLRPPPHYFSRSCERSQVRRRRDPTCRHVGVGHDSRPTSFVH